MNGQLVSLFDSSSFKIDLSSSKVTSTPMLSNAPLKECRIHIPSTFTALIWLPGNHSSVHAMAVSFDWTVLQYSSLNIKI